MESVIVEPAPHAYRMLSAICEKPRLLPPLSSFMNLTEKSESLPVRTAKQL